jgi:hypothetical protein
MADDISRRDVFVGIASVAGAVVLPSTRASVEPVPLHPWPGAPKLPKAMDVLRPNPAFDEFSRFGKSSRESRAL